MKRAEENKKRKKRVERKKGNKREEERKQEERRKEGIKEKKRRRKGKTSGESGWMKKIGNEEIQKEKENKGLTRIGDDNIKNKTKGDHQKNAKRKGDKENR